MNECYNCILDTNFNIAYSQYHNQYQHQIMTEMLPILPSRPQSQDNHNKINTHHYTDIASQVYNNDTSIICRDLLLDLFSPSIATVASRSADDLASSLGYDSFYHLIRPFGLQLSSVFNIKNTQLITNSYRHFSVRFQRSVIETLTVQANSRGLAAGSGSGGVGGAVGGGTAREYYELFRTAELNKVMVEYVKQVDQEIKKILADPESNSNNKETEARIKILRNSLYLKLIAKVYSNQLILPFETFNHPIIHLIVLTSEDSPESINDILMRNRLTRKKHLLLSPDLRADANAREGEYTATATANKNNSGVTGYGLEVNIPNYLDLSSDEDSLICFMILNDGTVPGDDLKCNELKSYVKKKFYYPCLSLKLKDVENNSGPYTGLYSNKNRRDDCNDNGNISYEELIRPGIFSSIREELEEIEFKKSRRKSASHSDNTEGKESDENNIDQLTDKDYHNIKNMLTELVKLNLIPFMEKKISYWDDIYVQPRKSITNRFFSASKRFLSKGSNSDSTGLSATYYHGNSSLSGSTSGFDFHDGYYPHHSSEAMIRKLADWAFMLRDYKYSYSTYDLLKKDLNNSKAWTYYASCQEMAVHSLLFDMIAQQTHSLSAALSSSSSLSSLSSSGIHSNTGFGGYSISTIKSKLDVIFQTIDSVNYTYISRCNLRSFALRFQLSVAELFNCLKINTFLDLLLSHGHGHSGGGGGLISDGFGGGGSSGSGSSGGSMHMLGSSYVHYNNIYSIKYLNEIIALKLLNYTVVVSSPAATSAENQTTKKIVPSPTEERSFHVLKAMIMERISYCYAIYLYNHSKFPVLLRRQLITQPKDVTLTINRCTDVPNTFTKLQNERRNGNNKNDASNANDDDEYPELAYIFRKVKPVKKQGEQQQHPQDTEEIPNPYKLTRTNLAVLGLTRYRKAAFWQLLALNQWEHQHDAIQLKLSVEAATKAVYGDVSLSNIEKIVIEEAGNAGDVQRGEEGKGKVSTNIWLHRKEGLLGKFAQLELHDDKK